MKVDIATNTSRFYAGVAISPETFERLSSFRLGPASFIEAIEPSGNTIWIRVDAVDFIRIYGDES